MALYRALLRLYPASFRAEYGDEMCAIFARRRREVTGIFQMLVLWLEALEDIASSALRAHGDILHQDLAFCARSLRRSPGFALTTVTVAALGIGATTAAFSITDHVLFRPLPFVQPDRLVRLWQDQGGYGHTELSPANYRDWKRTSRSFDEMGAFGGQACNLGGDGEPERLDGAWVTAEVLRMLGVRPALGRVFGPEDDAPEAPATIVLGHALWQARFGGEASVLGRQVLLDGTPTSRTDRTRTSMESPDSTMASRSRRLAPRCGSSPHNWSGRSRTRTRIPARPSTVCATSCRPSPACSRWRSSARRLASC